MRLDSYKKKRNFKKTLEPKGKISHQHKNLFVIQKHDASHLHYDFRLELNGILLSWAIPKGPCLDPTVKRLAVHVEDHPVEYGHFEGIIPKSEYGGGIVMLWDVGKWSCMNENPLAAYHKGHLKFILKAKKLNGEWNLVRLNKDNDKSWFLIKGKDKFAKSFSKYDITVKKPNSILTGFNLEEIEENHQNIWTRSGLTKSKPKKKKAPNLQINLPKSAMPTAIQPQLATLVNAPPTGNEWLHELKFDGYRILAFKNNKNIRLISRNNKEWTKYFPNIVAEIKKIPVKKIIFDGEIVLLDEKQKSNFQLLQNSIGTNQPFIYYIFDLLYYENYNLISIPLIERKNILKDLLAVFHQNILRYSDHITGSGVGVFQNACEMGLEGIISKQASSIYEEKRSKTWVKIKCLHRQEFVIGGFSPPHGSRSYFGSLYLGYYDKEGDLKYCGNVGTGFTQDSLKQVYGLLKKNIISNNPFSTRPPGITSATWVKPILVAEIEFSEWTSEKILRHPAFKGLRMDKPAKKITKEKATNVSTITERNASKKTSASVKFTHPDKILYPEDKFTKLDLANYYHEIQEWILPYIINRPLTLVRCPDNYHKCFYQKHIAESTPNALFEIKIKEKKGVDSYIYIKNSLGLMALIQMGSLEIHPWGSTIKKIEFPDMITFDLDPAPDVAWKNVVATARRIRQFLLDFKLQSFVKTTGGKGLHIVIPIKPEYDWEQVKNFAHVFVKFLVTNYPKEYTDKMSKNQRSGKIFIDYLRNQRGATSIAAYSTRARVHAPVAVPVHWDELTNNIKDTQFNIITLPKRIIKLKSDPWKDFFKIQQSLHLEKI